MERDSGSVTAAFHGCRSAVGGRLRAGGRPVLVQGERAERCNTRARCSTNAGVVCRMPRRHGEIADRVRNRRRRDCVAMPSVGSRYGAEHVPRTRSRRAVRTLSRLGSRWGACPGKGILGRIRPSLPRRPCEDGHLLQLERCHDVQQHSGGLAAAGGGGRAPRRRVDWSCGSACRRWPGARSGAAC
jgi:hypothetical protein